MYTCPRTVCPKPKISLTEDRNHGRTSCSKLRLPKWSTCAKLDKAAETSPVPGSVFVKSSPMAHDALGRQETCDFPAISRSITGLGESEIFVQLHGPGTLREVSGVQGACCFLLRVRILLPQPALLPPKPLTALNAPNPKLPKS